MFPLQIKRGALKLIKMEKNNFKEISKLKDEAEQILAETADFTELDVQSTKDRIEKLKWDVTYHSKKVKEAKMELHFLIESLSVAMAEQLEPTNEPINIEPLTNSHV